MCKIFFPHLFMNYGFCFLSSMFVQ
uniref:Uncharacterized protein n=1 Tax=Rhizophora mucronata TaxID=61149 RepID=A0A2P2NKI1_RHIMU